MSIADVCRAAKSAGAELALLTSERKDDALRHVADALERRIDEILLENAEDLTEARKARLPEALVDRLLLDEGRLREIILSVRQVADLPDPIGEVVHGWRLYNGLEVREQRVPLGVVAVVYESRPSVTAEAAALCVKTGNAIILRGGSAARHTNRMLAEVIEGALLQSGLPGRSVSHLSPDRDELLDLLQQHDLVDIIIPRGGADLMAYLRAHSTIPVLFEARGNCHVYVDVAADLEKAFAVVVNAKCQRPAVCNAMETLLVHEKAAPKFLPRMLTELNRRGVELAVDRATATLAPTLPLKRANRAHYEAEFLSLKLAVRVVASLDEAVDHIATYGTGHSEAIITQDASAAKAFTRRVDAACVYVNASTRFTDGGQFGFGGEIGISTEKLHARGPLGLAALTCTKYVVWGDGQVRP